MATLTAKEVAEKLKTDARTFRKFIRSEVKAAGGTVGVETPGKGKRYSFESKEISSLRKRYAAWEETRRVAKEAEETEVEETDAETQEISDAEVEDLTEVLG